MVDRAEREREREWERKRVSYQWHSKSTRDRILLKHSRVREERERIERVSEMIL